MYKFIKGFVRLPSHVTTKKNFRFFIFKGVVAKAYPANLEVKMDFDFFQGLKFLQNSLSKKKICKLFYCLMKCLSFKHLKANFFIEHWKSNKIFFWTLNKRFFYKLVQTLLVSVLQLIFFLENLLLPIFIKSSSFQALLHKNFFEEAYYKKLSLKPLNQQPPKKSAVMALTNLKADGACAKCRRSEFSMFRRLQNGNNFIETF